MWWFRILVLAVAASLVGACGFQPLYGGGGQSEVAAELSSIRVNSIPDRLGQQVRNQLLDRLNPQGESADVRYVLKVTLTDNIQELAVRKSEIATRANFELKATYSLVDTTTNKQVFSDNVFSISSYNILSADFATLASERDAQERAAERVAENITIRLALFLKGERSAERVPTR